MSNLVKQKSEITRHLHQVVDVLICQLLNLRKEAALSYTSQPDSKANHICIAFHFKIEIKSASQFSKSIIQAYTQ